MQHNLDLNRLKTIGWLHAPQTQRLIAAFPNPDLNLRFVGGCVRDALLGIEAEDIDLATPFKPHEVQALLTAANIKTVPLGLEHGSLVAIVNHKPFQITTLRADIETDGRHAKVAFTTCWQEDAKRRDFTFNALYLAPTGDLEDPFEGCQDLTSGIVRFIGDPEARIQEDYLRILRFFRFFARFGKGNPDAAGLQACGKYAAQLEFLSGERIHAEMMKLLGTQHPEPALQAMQDVGILEVLLEPKSADARSIDFLRSLIALEEIYKVAGNPLARLVSLAHRNRAQLSRIMDRWRFSKNERQFVERLVEAQQLIQDPRRLIYGFGPEIALYAALIEEARHPEVPQLASLMAILKNWRNPIFPLQGKDIVRLGLTPGPRIGEVLAEVEQWWIRENFTPDKKACLEKAAEFLA
ncbi:MAG: CCA tRNA nucleotidyltransferase [Holosporales bacterium]